MAKKRGLFIILAIIITVFLFSLYILFLNSNEQYKFIPYVLGSFIVFSIYIINQVT